MTIRHKLLASFIFIIVVFSLLSVYLTLALKKQGDMTIYAFNTPLSAVNNSRAAAETFRLSSTYVNEVLAFEYPRDSQETARKFDQLKESFNTHLLLVEQNSLTDDGANKSKEIFNNANIWFAEVNKHILGKNHQSLMDLRHVTSLNNQIQQQLISLANETEQLAQQLSINVENEIQQQQSIIYILLATIAFVAFIAVFFLTSSLLKPIQLLKTAVIELSRGDGDLTRRLTVNRSDEIGQLSHEFNQFIEKVHYSVKNIAQSVNDSNIQLAEFSSISEKTQQGTAEQKAVISNISTAMEQVIVSVSSVNESTKQAQVQANNIYSETENGVELVRKSTTEMANLNELIDDASTSIFELSKSCNDIGTVLEIIESIAEQTNLLALNAAIEAARAGDAGRGFSVVADEVRSLAMKTQESTLNIQNTIVKVQQQANEAKALMETGLTGAKSCAQNNQELSTAFEQILGSAKEIRQTNLTVSEQTDQQSQAVSHTNEFLTNIVSIADETAKGSDQLQENSALAIQSMTEVNATVANFRI